MTYERPSRVKNRRSLQVEMLENRELFSTDGFAGYGSLNYSFAPDGALVGNNVSQLRTKFDAVAPTEQWQQAIAKAIQTWVQNTNINIGRVDDDGSASGVYGPTRGDERFGDIRISGFAFAGDTLAEGVFEASRSVGTWAGDIFFNTAAKWTSVEQIEAVTLHELGHVLGLEHSSDPLSPMFSHLGNAIRSPTNQDIVNLQRIHGARELDPSEGNQGNDTIGHASRVRGSDEDSTVADGFNGTQVWIQFGDLHASADRDFIEIKIDPNYRGPVAVKLQTRGLSLARLGAEIVDRQGNILAQGIVNNSTSDFLILSLSETAPDAKYYLQIHSTDETFWSAGDYALQVATESRFAENGKSIDDWTQNAHRWYYDSHRTRNGFSWHLETGDSRGPSDDDRATDNTIDKASMLPVVLDTPSRVRHAIVGSLTGTIDVDFYRVVTPKNLQNRTELSIDVESLQFDGVVPAVRVFDRVGIQLYPEVRVQGYGQLQLVLKDIQPEQDFRIEIKSANSVSTGNKQGSYSLNVNITLPSEAPKILLAGTLTPNQLFVEREWYIAEPQLFGLSLRSTSAAASDGQVWVSIFDSNRRLIGGLVTVQGELRTAPGIFLDSGTYYLQVSTSIGLQESESASFEIYSDNPSRPIGVVLGSKNVQPAFLCPGSTSEFCYPNTTAPTTQPEMIGPAPTPALPKPTTPVKVTSPSSFFWSNYFSPTNPTNPLDSTGDNRVDPLDVLLIINAINRIGMGPVPTPPQFEGFLDTNRNGQLDPLDALSVVNYLNRIL